MALIHQLSHESVGGVVVGVVVGVAVVLLVGVVLVLVSMTGADGEVVDVGVLVDISDDVVVEGVVVAAD